MASPNELLQQPPAALAHALTAAGLQRACVTWDADARAPRPSHALLEPLAAALASDRRDYDRHEGLFFAVGPRSGALFLAAVHDTRRGAGAGGLRHWPYPTLAALVHDGLRLARGMTRKSALAGLWWGGGKGIIARATDDSWRDPAARRLLYREYGRFVTGLRGCYVTAEDAGTGPADMAEVFATTRHVTCIPPSTGGSGNPSGATAIGVVCAMEGALAELGRDSLAGITVAMQGAGNVGAPMIAALLERGVGRIVATDIDGERVAALRDRFAGAPLELRLVAADDDAIVEEPCDVFAPNALGGGLNPDTIPRLRAQVVCGAANNQLLDERRDAEALRARGITYVPDYLCNRMGIVQCANEAYGQIPHDPAITRHFGRDWDNAVYVITRRVLQRAASQGITTAQAANELADELAAQPHPIWGHRGHAIIAGLLADGWAEGRDDDA